MDPAAASRLTRSLRADGGFSTVQFTLTAGLGLVLFVMLANAIVVQYAAGVLRTAADEGSRAAAWTGAPISACHTAAADAVNNLLGGTMGDRVQTGCHYEGAFVRAEIRGVFRWWLPGIPDSSFTAVSLHRREEAP